MKRACGVLLPISSLPSPYGIGTFSKEAYEFVDNLSKAGIKITDIKDFFDIEDREAAYNKLYKFVYVDKRQHALAGGINISERGCRYTVLACGFETAQCRHDNLFTDRVNPDEGLVQKDTIRLLNQAASNQDSLELPARQLANLTLCQVF